MLKACFAVIACVLVACTVTSSTGTPTKVLGPYLVKPVGEPTTMPDVITKDAPIFYVYYQSSAKSGDKLTGTLTGVDVGSAAPPNTKVAETSIDLTGLLNAASGSFEFSKPTAGWPAGSYRIDIKNGATALGSITFNVK